MTIIAGTQVLDKPSTLLMNGTAAEITKLHTEIVDSLRTNLGKAMRIGELLTEAKAGLPHGDFGNWCELNLPFTTRTAQNYLRLHRERDRLKNETVSHLGEAYRLLAAPAAEEQPVSLSARLACPADQTAPHQPEEWEPLAGETRIGRFPDGRIILMEGLPGGVYVRFLICDADYHGYSFQKRGINRYYLRWALAVCEDIEPDSVDWWGVLPATKESNPFSDSLKEWRYDAAGAAA